MNYSQQKDEEAAGLEALQALAVASYQPPPDYATGVPSPPTGMTIRPLLPPKLWPHSFLLFSAVVGSILGVFSILTLTFVIPAMINAYLSRKQSKLGNYSGAKAHSKMAVLLMTLAVGVFAIGWFSGWTFGGFLIDCFVNRGCFH